MTLEISALHKRLVAIDDLDTKSPGEFSVSVDRVAPDLHDHGEGPACRHAWSRTCRRCRSDKARISVGDRGTGVPEASLARLGEPFFGPELARTRATGGFGLGLAIVRRCIAACEGEVNRACGGFEAHILLPITSSSV